MNTELSPRIARRTPRSTFSWIGGALLTIIPATLFGTILLRFLLGILAGFLELDLNEIVSSETYLWISSFAPMYCVGIPAALLILKTLPAQPCTPLRLRAGDFLLLMLMCFPLMYGGSILGSLLSSFLSGGAAENALDDYIYESVLLKILFFVILAPVLEEFLFRKQIIDRCARYGEKTAVLFSAVTFGLFHMNLYQLFYAFALGLVFGYVYLRTRRLRCSVIMHMAVNFFGSVLSPLIYEWEEDAVEAFPAAEAAESEFVMVDSPLALAGTLFYELLIIGLCIAGIVVLITKLPKLRFQPAEEELPKGQRFSTVFCNPGMIAFVLFCAASCVLALFM